MSALLAASDLITAAAPAVLAGVVPDPGSGSMPPGFEAFTTVMGWAKWVGLGVAVVGLIILGVTMTVSARRGEGGEIGGWRRVGSGRRRDVGEPQCGSARRHQRSLPPAGDHVVVKLRSTTARRRGSPHYVGICRR